MRAIRRLQDDEDGTILVFVAIALAVLLGMVALSFDMGRMASTQTELQSFADNVALAAAGELDGNPTAIGRAEAVVTQMLAQLPDSQTFGSGGAVLDRSDVELVYLSQIDPDDAPPYADTVTTDPLAARFVRATVDPHTVPLTFASAFAVLSGNDEPDSAVDATAVAGFTQFACDITPLMFCLPEDWKGASNHVGQMMVLRAGRSGTAAWGPGDFGFLDPSQQYVDDEGPCAGKTGVNLDACLIGAIDTITQCFALQGVETDPGQRTGINDSLFNVRFDLYQTLMSGERNDADYAPAPNVIKGTVPKGGGACIGNNAEPSPNSMGLPHEYCLNPGGGCDRFSSDMRFDGQERLDYVEKNYGDGNPATNDDPFPTARTRYEYYLAEIAAHDTPPEPYDILTGRAETGRPQCSSHPKVAGPERRVIVAAGVDCVALEAAGNPINGREVDVPVEEFVEIFLTEPVNDGDVNPPDFSIYGEVVGPAKRNGNSGILHDLVQLYR